MKSKLLFFSLVLLGISLALSPISASETDDWSTPDNLSGWQVGIYDPRVLLADNGAEAVIWTRYDPVQKRTSLWARVRTSGAGWTPAKNIFGWADVKSFLEKTMLAPDGTFWALVSIEDDSQSGNNIQVKTARWSGEGPWQVEAISNFETAVRNIDLSSGPDGHITASWTACASTTPNDQGPCDVRVRRRNPGNNTWETRDESIDQTLKGILYTRALTGPGGLVVAVWAEANPTTAGEWYIKSAAFDPVTRTWENPPKNVSNGPVRSNVWPLLSGPVMGADGTVITAWYSLDLGDLNQADLYSATRQAGSGSWSLPTPLTDAHQASLYGPPELAVGMDGTALASWEQKNNPTPPYEHAVYVKVRDPGSTWDSVPQKISAWREQMDLAVPQVLPDGTCLLVWEFVEGSRDSSENESIFWNARSPKGSWGDMGKGQLDGWFNRIDGISLGITHDGSVNALWGVGDKSYSSDEQAAVNSAAWIPGTGSILVTTISERHYMVYVSEYGLATSEDGLSKAAVWKSQKLIQQPQVEPGDAAFYSNYNPFKNLVYLPIISGY